MKTRVDALDRTIQESTAWVHAVEERLNVQNPRLALSSLAATLHVIRGHLTRDEAVRFAETLPLFLRGVFFEGWLPEDTPAPTTDRSEFLERLRGDAIQQLNVKAERAAKAALGVLAQRIPASEMAAVVARLPQDLKELWPDEAPPLPDARSSEPIAVPDDELRASRMSPNRQRRSTRRAPGETGGNAIVDKRNPTRRARLQAAQSRQAETARRKKAASEEMEAIADDIVDAVTEELDELDALAAESANDAQRGSSVPMTIWRIAATAWLTAVALALLPVVRYLRGRGKQPEQ